MKTSQAAPAPNHPPLIPFGDIYSEVLGGKLGRDRVRMAMRHPKAPQPVIGGPKGRKALWNRAEVVKYWDGIAKHGLPAVEGATA